MAEKDILEKILMHHADVFADCINALVYEGERRVSAEELQPAPTESFYRGKQLSRGKSGIRNQFCDVSFYFMENGDVKLQYILENETRPEKRLILRKISYQGGAYRRQLETGKAVYPVISLVLDWRARGNLPTGEKAGSKVPGIPRSLHELLVQCGTERRELQMVDDARLEIYHMGNLPEDIRERFQSDMGFIVDYLNEGNFEKRMYQEIIHVEAVCEMMEALTEDTRFTEAIEELMRKQGEGRKIIMCEYIDMLEARGEARGKEIGKEIGEKIGKEIGENNLARLLLLLYSQGREEDARLAVQSVEARKEMYREFCIV